MAPTTESRLNVDALSKRDVLLLFSVLEGELEARDLVIQALRAQHRDTYVWERYGRYDQSDPFLALQRDGEALQDPTQGRGDGASFSQTQEVNPRRWDPLTMLKVVVGHCRRMHEKMLKQLAAAENRHKRVIADLEEEKRRHAEETAEGDDVTCILEKERERLLQQLEFERTKVSQVEKENKRLLGQLEDERAQHKHLMTALGQECKRSGSRAHEEAQRANELRLRLERQHIASQSLQMELEKEKKHAMQMEARREKQLAEFDTERELLSLKLKKEESRCSALQKEVDRLMKEVRELRGEEKEVGGSRISPVGNGAVEVNVHHAHIRETATDGRQRVENGEENEISLPPLSPDKSTLINGSLQTTNLNIDSLSTCSMSSSPQTSCPSILQAAYQAGIQQRFHAARHKFQSNGEQESLAGCSLPQSPCELSACTPSSPPAEGSNCKLAARNTLTQAIGRFSTKTPSSSNSSPFSTDYRSVAATGVLSPGIRSPLIPRAERGIPPPIPPKKPGLAETPPSPATLRAAHMTQMSAGCGRKSTESTKDPDLLLPSHS